MLKMLPWGPIGRLACILAGVGLVTSRLGLIAHELLGHGGAAIALGGTVLDVELYWFAGGWIRYQLPADANLGGHLVATLGGIGLEVVAGMALWIVLARRTSLVARIARATGGAMAMHGALYLAAGTYHGYGDGRLVRYAVGDAWRYVVAIAAGAFVIAMAFVSARAILGVLAGTLPNRRVAGTVIAIVIAGGLHGGLILAELTLRTEETYGVIMQSERERIVATELAKWQREQQARGIDVDEAERRAREAALREATRELPFQWILGTLVVVAVLLGWRRARPDHAGHVIDQIPRRIVIASIIAAVGSVALVIAIDAAFA